MQDKDEIREAANTYQNRPRTCGLRLSALDVVVLIASVILGVGLYKITFGYSVFILFVVLHFFLFCNVFRIRRMPELIWAGTFLANCAIWVVFNRLNIIGICVSQIVVTIGVIANELRLPSYHGIFSRKINPRIEEYLQGEIPPQSS